jgi:hypothetical protein
MNALLRASALGSAVLLSGLLTGCAPQEGVESDEYALGPDPHELHGKPEPPMLGVHEARGNSRPGGGGGSPNLSYKGGAVMGSAAITPIFWGPTISADAAKKSGLDAFYAAYVGSNYAKTNVEYTGAGGPVTATNISVNAGISDPTAAPNHVPKTSDILAAVCRNISKPVADGYYPVYTDTRRGSAGYCAWHSWGACNGINIQFGFFFNLDGDGGCDPGDPGTNRSQGLEALANVTGHELSEAVTDPRGTGWTDAQGSENADKCAWVFPANVTLSDGSSWRVQGNWSNAAYNAGSGYANNAGQKGCINGN